MYYAPGITRLHMNRCHPMCCTACPVDRENIFTRQYKYFEGVPEVGEGGDYCEKHLPLTYLLEEFCGDVIRGEKDDVQAMQQQKPKPVKELMLIVSLGRLGLTLAILGTAQDVVIEPSLYLLGTNSRGGQYCNH